ncbi:hypothetical protein KKH27_10305 [bacterium]|nr:hypothetical protein [bacterium]MBU1984325.1 hypothetical protein [bacterium]
MAHSIATHDSQFYRPRRLPRVLRRQAPVLRLCAVILLFGLLAAAVAWRNLVHDRLVWEVGRNRATIANLNTEILHLSSQIEVESSYARVTRWAEDTRKWKMIAGQSERFVIPATALNDAARRQAKLQRMLPDE